MKRLLCALLILFLLLPLAGCSLFSARIQEPVNFYYQCSDYLYREDMRVITAEVRDAGEHIEDLDYLMRLYFLGPHDEELRSPFPKGLRVTDIRIGNDTVILTLSDQMDTLQGTQHSLACACLALTCMDITGVQSVTLMTQSTLLTLDQNSLTLYADSIPDSE